MGLFIKKNALSVIGTPYTYFYTLGELKSRLGPKSESSEAKNWKSAKEVCWVWHQCSNIGQNKKYDAKTF